MNHDVIPQKLKSARVMKGWSMDDLCSHMSPSVSKMTISRFEKGELKPKPDHLKALSAALGVPCDYFFRSARLGIEAIAFRKKSRFPVKTRKSVEQKTVDFVERLIEAEELNGFFQEETLPSFATSDTNDSRCAARALREKWRLGDGCIGNVIDMLEAHGVKIAEMEALDGFDGLSAMAEGKYPVIALATSAIPERKRLTALHELGHLILTFPQDCPLTEQEHQCNSFASEMLLPETQLKKMLRDAGHEANYYDILPIQKEFGISYDAIMYKMFELGIITEKRYTGFQVYKNKKRDYKRRIEESHWHSERSDRLERLVRRAMERGGITGSKAAVLLDKSIDYVKRELCPG